MSDLRQGLLLKELPKNNFSIKKSAEKVGYSKDYAKSGIYEQIRESKTFASLRNEPDKIKRDFDKAKRLALKTGDLSNYNRANEALARINAMFTDKSEVKSNPTNIIITHDRATVMEDNKILP